MKTDSASKNPSAGPAGVAYGVAARGVLPDRYSESLRASFVRLTDGLVHPNVRILDIGSGRQPAIPADRRPPNCHYIGLDISRSELEAAPSGSYDEIVACDITQHVPGFVDRFDLAISYQVFEHVKPLRTAIDNVRSYLVPGGHLVAQTSGSATVIALLNKLLPHRFAKWLVHKLTGRRMESIFPAHYDQCTYSKLERLGDSWESFEVVPMYMGAYYFQFSKLLQALYVLFEEFTFRRGYRSLAPYYRLIAVR